MKINLSLNPISIELLELPFIEDSQSLITTQTCNASKNGLFEDTFYENTNGQ